MGKRKPQINFQVEEPMKLLYEEAKISGHWVTRFCSAGLLLMVEDPAVRLRALNRLREWEAEYGDASLEDIRTFVQNVQADYAQRPPAPARPARKTKATRKSARRSRP
jgi:hypothetical protein